MKILVISDNHGYVDEGILHHAAWADEVWHAGDWLNTAMHEAITKIGKPIIGVHGNIDGMDVKVEYPDVQLFDREGFRILMIHIGGKPGRYPANVKDIINKTKPDISLRRFSSRTRTSTFPHRATSATCRPFSDVQSSL